MFVRVIGKPLGKYRVGDEFGSPAGEANVLILLGRVEPCESTPGLAVESFAGSGEPQRTKRKYTRRDQTDRNLETK
jgi:hypothetical protein